VPVIIAVVGLGDGNGFNFLVGLQYVICLEPRQVLNFLCSRNSFFPNILETTFCFSSKDKT
jgi:hypothetical protein